MELGQRVTSRYVDAAPDRWSDTDQRYFELVYLRAPRRCHDSLSILRRFVQREHSFIHAIPSARVVVARISVFCTGTTKTNPIDRCSRRKTVIRPQPRLPVRASRLRRIARVERRDDSYFQPRLYDLRHTFAVHRLTEWYRQHADVQRLVPLSTYLGHVNLSTTQGYLTMTPELIEQAGVDSSSTRAEVPINPRTT